MNPWRGPSFTALFLVALILWGIFLLSTKSEKAKRAIGACLGLLVIVTAAWWAYGLLTIIAR